MARTAGTSKKIGAIAVAFGMMLGGAVAVASSASAHTADVSTTCAALTVNLADYQVGAGTNGVIVKVNGATVADNSNFGTTWTGTFPLLPNQDNAYMVMVNAWDGSQWSINKSGNQAGCPTSPAPVVTLGYSTSCGVITLTTTNNASVPATWYYGLKGSVGGTQVVSAVKQGPGTKTSSYTFAEDQGGGSVDVAVTVYAATEQDLLPAEWHYGVVKTVTVNTNCAAPVTHEVTPPTVTKPTCDAVGHVNTLPTSNYYAWVLNPRTGIYTAIPVNAITHLSGTLTFNPGPLDQLNCVQEINVTPPVYIAPTCYAAGSIDLGDSRLYKWVLNTDTGIYIAVAKVGPSHLNGTTRFGPAPLAQLSCTRTIIIPVTPPTFTPGTCTAVGSVAAADTVNYRWVVTGPATAPSYAAVAKNGEVLSGITTFGPFDLSQIPSQSVDAAVLCYVAPPAVAGEVKGVVKNAPAKAAPAKAAPAKAAPAKAAPVKAAPAPAVAPAVKTLAFTGAETVPLGLSGLLALLLGAVLTVASRQRPKQARE